jgi:hypothetical protein
MAACELGEVRWSLRLLFADKRGGNGREMMWRGGMMVLDAFVVAREAKDAPTMQDVGAAVVAA